MLFRDTIPNIIALQFLGVGITILLLVGIILLWRKRNYPNSRVLFKDTTPKIVALQVLGWGITILGMMSITLFWRHSFRLAIFYVALAALFHPTPGGVLITLGSIAAMFVLVVWGARKYPHLRRQDWKTLFDRDPES